MPLPAPPPPPLVRTGDAIGAFTFLGVNVTGQTVCQCACGAIEALPAKLVAEPLKPARRDQLRRKRLLRCRECQRIHGDLTSAVLSFVPSGRAGRPVAR